MALNKQAMTRVFNYAGVRLPDPDPAMSLTEVRDFFANTGRPELTSAEVRGPEVVGTEQVYTLHRVTGTKGGPKANPPQRSEPARVSRAMAVELDRLSRRNDVGAIAAADAVVLTRLAANTGNNPCYLPSSEVPWIA